MVKPENFFLLVAMMLTLVYAAAISPLKHYFHGVERSLQVVDYAMAAIGRSGQMPVSFLYLAEEARPGKLHSLYPSQMKSWDTEFKHTRRLLRSSIEDNIPENENSFERFKRLMKIPLAPDRTVPYKTRGEPAHYPVIGFIPYILPVMTGLLLEWPPVMILHGAVIGNALFSICLGYLMIRMIPVMKWGYTFLLLMPSLFAMRLVIMPDALCLELCMLLVALVLRYMVKPQLLSHAAQMLLTLLAVLVGSIKVAYFTIPSLYVLIPRECFRFSWSRWRFVICALFTSAAASVLWAMYIKSGHTHSAGGFWYGERWHYTYRLLTHPWFSLQVAMDTLFSLRSEGLWLENMFLWPFWFGGGYDWVPWAGSVILMISVILPVGDSDLCLRWWHRLVGFLGFFSVFLVVFIAKTMTTPIGTGIQGRYLTPAFLLGMVSFYNLLGKSGKKLAWAAPVFIGAGIIIWIEMHYYMFRMLHII